MFDGKNRVADAIAKTKIALEHIPQEKYDEMGETMLFSTEEVMALQNQKSLAVAEGKLTVDEGNTVYSALGGEMALPEHINEQPLEVRVVLTRLLAELMGMKS